MFRTIAALYLATVPAHAEATFANRGEMVDFIGQHMTERDFGPLITRLDAAGEYSPAQIESVAEQLREIYTDEFTTATQLRYRETPPGFREEVISFWREGGKYIFLYVFSHEAPDGIHVLTFSINSRAENVLPLFQ